MKHSKLFQLWKTKIPAMWPRWPSVDSSRFNK
jgi:hypothetical protein